MKNKSIAALAILSILIATCACSLNFPGQAIAPPPDLPLPADVIVTNDPAALSPSPSPTFTPTLEKLTLGVSTDTNCRSGPGSVYDRLGGIQVGETAEIFARDPGSQYFFIQNPDDASGSCWVWNRYATPSGSTAGLPVFTPPPTPTQPVSDSPTYTPTTNSLHVTIATKDSSLHPVFKVTGVQVSSLYPSISGVCPKLAYWRGTITANGTGTVKYRWEVVGTSIVGASELIFLAAGTMNAHDFGIGVESTSTVKARIHITAPNEMYSNEVPISVTCTQ